MTKLLEAAKIVLEEDIIPSLPSRKRLSALLVEEALSIVRIQHINWLGRRRMRQLKIIKCYQIKLDQVFMTLL